MLYPLPNLCVAGRDVLPYGFWNSVVFVLMATQNSSASNSFAADICKAITGAVTAVLNKYQKDKGNSDDDFIDVPPTKKRRMW